MTLVPIFNFESSNQTYVEARYNYEELNAFSFYLGRTFTGKNKLTYSVTPILGGVVGKFRGGSAGVNVVAEYGKIFFSTQSQYTVSFHEASDDFLFAWSDLVYQPWKWFYVGLSTQQTLLTHDKSFVGESGIALGFVKGKWTFPLYCFSPLGDGKYLVLGINYNAGSLKRNK